MDNSNSDSSIKLCNVSGRDAENQYNFDTESQKSEKIILSSESDCIAHTSKNETKKLLLLFKMFVISPTAVGLIYFFQARMLLGYYWVPLAIAILIASSDIFAYRSIRKHPRELLTLGEVIKSTMITMFIVFLLLFFIYLAAIENNSPPVGLAILMASMLWDVILSTIALSVILETISIGILNKLYKGKENVQ